MTRDEKAGRDRAFVDVRIGAANAEAADAGLAGARIEIGGVSFGPGASELHRPLFWLTLEDVGIGQRSGPLDFCSHRCLAAWCVDAEVRRAFADDYLEQS
jgi:hypothetical protein